MPSAKQMSKTVIIITVVVAIILIAFFVIKKKKAAAEAASGQDMTYGEYFSDETPADTTRKDFMGVKKETAAAMFVLGNPLAAAFNKNKGVCVTNCKALHPFSASKRDACIAGCQ